MAQMIKRPVKDSLSTATEENCHYCDI